NRKVLLDLTQIEILTNRLVTIFDELKSSQVLRLKIGNTENFSWSRNSSYYYNFLLKIYNEFPNYVNVEHLIYENLKSNLYIDNNSPFEQEDYIDLISKLDLGRLELNKGHAINALVSNLM